MKVHTVPGIAVYPGSIGFNDILPGPGFSVEHRPFQIVIRYLGNGQYDDGFGWAVGVYFASDGMICAQYRDHSYYVEIDPSDWPFPKPEGSGDE